MTTLKDVAERAGVSVGLVSYVLNGKKKVRPETYQRIQDAVEELDYYPNLVASGLKTNSSKMIGVVISDMRDWYIMEIVSDIEADLRELGYCMNICNSGNSVKKERKCIRNLLSHSIDGLILIGTGETDYTFLNNQKIPVVVVDRMSGEGIVTVKTDDALAGRIGAEYLHKKGYESVCFFSLEKRQYAQNRERGFLEYMQKNSLKSQVMRLKDNSFEKIEQAVKKYLRTGEYKKSRSAIFCCKDDMAVYAVRALSEQGIRIPEDVAVLGFDNSSIGEFSNPPITSVAQDKIGISKNTVDVMMRMINGEKKIKNVYLGSEIVERKSV